MVDFKKIIMILVITTLFAAFVGSLVFALHKNPQYDDVCRNQYYGYTEPVKEPYAPGNRTCTDIAVPEENKTACMEQKGNIQFRYDTQGCATTFYCDTCNAEFQDAQAKFNMYYFIYSAIFGLIGILIGIYYPNNKDEFRDTITTGFMFGGLVTLFIGTIVYFSDLVRELRPVILVIELGIIIFVAFKKMRSRNDIGEGKKINQR